MNNLEYNTNGYTCNTNKNITVNNTKCKSLNNDELYKLTVKFYNKPTLHVYYGKTKQACNVQFRKGFGMVLEPITKIWNIINEKDIIKPTAKVVENNLLNGMVEIKLSDDHKNFYKTSFVPIVSLSDLVDSIDNYLLKNVDHIKNTNRIFSNSNVCDIKIELVKNNIVGDFIKIFRKSHYDEDFFQSSSINYGSLELLKNEIKKFIR